MKLDLTNQLSSEIAYKRFSFPDGQPHLEIQAERNCRPCEVIARITNSDELLEVLMASDILKSLGYQPLHLSILYLMGARMDRRINKQNPFTLGVITDALENAYDSFSIFDPHSDVAPALLNASVHSPKHTIIRAIVDVKMKRGKIDAIVAPDAGAAKKVQSISYDMKIPMIQAFKHRDMETGKLSGFGVANPVPKDSILLIIDDLCDGGGTFTGLAKLLRDEGAATVDLYVSHGIFSKGLPLEGIDRIYTTQSYQSLKTSFDVVVGRDTYDSKYLTVLDIY